jgi:LAO/AO transport system kinase
MELKEMIEMRDASPMAGHHGAESLVDTADNGGTETETGTDEEGWQPTVVETIAKTGEGVEEFLGAITEHVAWLSESGELEVQARQRYEAEIKTLLREDTAALLEEELSARGGLESHIDRVLRKETDPYTIADELMAPIEDCVGEARREP